MSLISVVFAAETAAATASASPVAAVAQSFGLNLKLFLAQLVNFGLLVIILWRLLYRPLVTFLAERSQRIAEGLYNAERYETKLKELETERRVLLAKAEDGARVLLNQASEQAEAVKRQARADAEFEAKMIRERAIREAAEEKQVMLTEVQHAAADLVVAAAEKVLRERVDTAADRQLIERALKESTS